MKKLLLLTILLSLSSSIAIAKCGSCHTCDKKEVVEQVKKCDNKACQCDNCECIAPCKCS